MENNNNNNNTFINVIGKHFNEIKTKFMKQIQSLGFTFDNDVFSDTMIKCNDKYTKKNATDEEMINYFWGAFKMNTLREFNYSRNKYREDISAVTENDDIEDVTDNIYYEDDYEKVSNMIIDEFGLDLYKLFCLHANGMKYKDLVKTIDPRELHYKFKQIREYVRKNYKRDE